MPVSVPAGLGTREEIETGHPDAVIVNQNGRRAQGARHPAPLAGTGSNPIFSVQTLREIKMFVGLKRALLIIVASVTVLPWGMMQLVQ
jgi:hypothetical protein